MSLSLLTVVARAARLKVGLGLFFLVSVNMFAQAQTKTAADSDKVFGPVEHSAEYPGGISALYGFLGQNIRYPKTARENNVQGKVFVTFVVEKDGELSNVKVLRGIGSGCDEEAI